MELASEQSSTVGRKNEARDARRIGVLFQFENEAAELGPEETRQHGAIWVF